MKTIAAVISVCLLAAACGGSADNGASSDGASGAAESTARTVTIVMPADGAVQDSHDVTVSLTSTVPIVPAGEMTPGTGHYHLYLDADLGDMTAPIPTVPESIIHMGDGSSSHVFQDVSSGEHRLIAVVADGAHVPLHPLVVDTIHFVVE
jgi:Domain of unknown function (DUF4399)